MKKRIKDIADIQIGFQFRKKPEMSSLGEYQVIQAKDIDKLVGHSLVASSLYQLTPDRDATRYEVNDGDVIFMSKGRRNYASLVEGLHGRKTIAAGIFFILKLKSEIIMPEFLVWIINQSLVQNLIANISKGSGIPFITRDDFANVSIDIPDMHTQEIIVKLDQLSQREQLLMWQIQENRKKLVETVMLNKIKNS